MKFGDFVTLLRNLSLTELLDSDLPYDNMTDMTSAVKEDTSCICHTLTVELTLKATNLPIQLISHSGQHVLVFSKWNHISLNTMWHLWWPFK